MTISYGLLGLSGTISANSGFSLFSGSAVSSIGGTASLWSGKNDNNSLARKNASSSSSATMQAIPDLDACKFAPPSPAASTSPLITSGVSRGLDRKS